MRLVFVLAVIAAMSATVVAAVVFRSERAWSVLHTMRKFGWVYIIVIVLSAIYRLWIE